MDDEKLIFLVHQHEELFNVLHKRYSDNIQKDKTWRAIGEELHHSGATCKTRWFNLRDQYRRALKNKRTKIGHAAESKKKWKYEDEMSFLLPFLQERDAVPFIPQIEESNNGADGEAGDLLAQCETEEQNENLRNKEIQEAPVREQEREGRPSGTHGKCKMSKRRRSLNKDIPSAVLMNYLTKKCKRTRKPDRIDNFFLSVAATVKTLTQIRQNIVQSKIFAMVSEIEMEQLNDGESRGRSFKCVIPPGHHNEGYAQETYRSQIPASHY